MSSEKPVPRILQQSEPGAEQRPEQAGSSDAGSRPGAQSGGQQDIGEGSYEATRDYQKNIGEYLKKGDVEKDAQAAKPRSEQEARELNEAEQEGKSHSKGEH